MSLWPGRWVEWQQADGHGTGTLAKSLHQIHKKKAEGHTGPCTKMLHNKWNISSNKAIPSKQYHLRNKIQLYESMGGILKQATTSAIFVVLILDFFCFIYNMPFFFNYWEFQTMYFVSMYLQFFPLISASYISTSVLSPACLFFLIPETGDSSMCCPYTSGLESYPQECG